MAAAHGSTSSIVYDSDGGNVASSAPSGVTAGDFLLMLVSCHDGSNPTTPSGDGWALKGRQAAWFGTFETHLYYKEADGDSSDAPTVSCPAQPTTIVITRCTDVDTADPFDDWQTVESGGGGSSPVTAADATSTGTDKLAVIMGGAETAWTGTLAVETNSFTLQASRVANIPTWVATKSITSSGAIGTTDFDTTSDNAQRGAIHTIILNSAAAGGGVEGSLSETQDNNTISAAGALDITGSLSKTQDNNTVSAFGSSGASGALSETQDDNTISAAATLDITGALSETQDNNTISAAGTSAITGALSSTQDNNTISAAGTLAITGSASVTQDSDTVSSAAQLAITGSLSETQANNTISATGAELSEGPEVYCEYLAIMSDADEVVSVLMADGSEELAIMSDADVVKVAAMEDTYELLATIEC